MRRSERITAWAGLALVAATTLTTVVVLVEHGTRAVAVPEQSELLPADLAWSLFSACTLGPSFSGAMSVDSSDGRMRVDITESSLSNDAELAYEARVNACLAEYRIEDVNAVYLRGISDRADRMVAYDVALRWLLPCLAAHGIERDDVPTLADYLAENSAPWLGYYNTTSADRRGFETLVAARRACGSSTAPFAS